MKNNQTSNWNKADWERYREILPIVVKAITATELIKLTDKSVIGFSAVRITYGIVMAEKEMRGELSINEDQP